MVAPPVARNRTSVWVWLASAMPSPPVPSHAPSATPYIAGRRCGLRPVRSVAPAVRPQPYQYRGLLLALCLQQREQPWRNAACRSFTRVGSAQGSPGHLPIHLP